MTAKLSIWILCACLHPMRTRIILLVCADNFVTLTLWFGHVTSTKIVSPLNTEKPATLLLQERDFTWQHNSFFFPSYYPVSHLDTHTNIRGGGKIAKKELLFILFIYLKDAERRERRSLCRRRLLQILIQGLRRSLHELHFWSANKLAFFFPSPLSSISLSLQ